MDRANDNYCIGKHRTVTADELEKIHYESVSFNNKRFICPECGEYLTFVRRYKYKSYFKHSRSNDTTKHCELRSQSNQNFSIYERAGLPLYLKKCANNQFELNLGFYNIDENLIKTSQIEKFKVIINALMENQNLSVTYSVNDINFSTSSMTLKSINFVSEMYKLKYSSSNAERLLGTKWGNNIEGFSSYGALFTYSENGGRKIRINDEITTETDYYYICQNSNQLDRLNGVEYIYCGNMSLDSSYSTSIYKIYKICFKPRNEEQFNKLYYFCRDNFKISLIYKPSTLTAIWPPTIQKDNKISYFNYENEALFILNSEEKNGRAFIHGDNIVNQIEGYELRPDKFLVKIPIKEESVAVSINEKYNSICFFLERYRDNLKSYTNSICINSYEGNLINRGVYSELPTKKIVKISAESKCEIVHLKKNQYYKVYRIKSKKENVINNIDFDDELGIISVNEYIPFLQYVKKPLSGNCTINDEKLYINLRKVKGEFTVPPVWMKKMLCLLMDSPKTFVVVRKYVFESKMPVKAIKILKDIYKTKNGGADIG